MSFKKNFFKNLLIAGGYNYLSQLVTFVASLIISRILIPGDFGLVGLIAVFSGFITIFSDSGLSMAVIRSGYRQTYYRGLNFLSGLIGFLLFVAMLLLIYPISLFYSNTEILLPGIAIAFLFILKSLSIVPMAVLQKELRFGVAGRIFFISTLAGTVGTIVMAYAGFKYWSLIWSQYITALVSFLILYWHIPGLYTRTKFVVIIKSLALARVLIGRLLGFNIINYWARNADNLIVGKYYGTADLGIYNRAYMMLMLPLNLITGIFSSVLLPSFVKHKNEGGDIEQEYYFILKVISFINLPIAIMLILFPQALVTLLWGENWINVASLLPYFGLLVMTQTLVSTLASIMVMHKLEKQLMYTGWINAVFIVSGIILGATISLNAIAAFYSLAYILLVLPLYIFYVFNYKLKKQQNVLRFWLPKLFLSIYIWTGIYFSLFPLILSGLIIWVIVLFIDSRKEILLIKNRLHPMLSRIIS
ncbi:MAG: oligosaccharide flippase family protein [Panacibacter sp.]